MCRHLAEKTSLMYLMRYALGIFWLYLGAYDPTIDATSQLILSYGLDLPYSRKCESEADHIGILLMSKACYKPEVDLCQGIQQG
jgi:predicted Zn-dependent protease